MEQKEIKNLAKPGQYLTFVINKQCYGVPIGTVREINRVSEITPVPKAPHYVTGVMNLRGKVIPVVNLRTRLAFEAIPYTKETCIIVIETPQGQTGMIVDAVNGVMDLVSENIEAPPHMSNSNYSDYVMGMGKAENQIIILIDIVMTMSSAYEMPVEEEESLKTAA
jgi:purine-binding chemotaxis protein CheW